MNNIKNVDLIYVDQVLVIEGEAPVVAATPATTTPAPSANTEAPVQHQPQRLQKNSSSRRNFCPAAATPAPVAEESTTPAATVSGSEAEAKEWIAQKESGGSYTATNGRYIGRSN